MNVHYEYNLYFGVKLFTKDMCLMSFVCFGLFLFFFYSVGSRCIQNGSYSLGIMFNNCIKGRKMVCVCVCVCVCACACVWEGVGGGGGEMEVTLPAMKIYLGPSLHPLTQLAFHTSSSNMKGR